MNTGEIAEIIEAVKRLAAAGIAGYGPDPYFRGNTLEEQAYCVHVYRDNPIEKYDALAQIGTPRIVIECGGRYIKMEVPFEKHKFVCMLSQTELDIVKKAHPDIAIVERKSYI